MTPPAVTPPAATPPAGPSLPPLPLAAWEESKRTLHLYLQIIGKIRLALHPKLNHWWHVPLYVSPCGLTTGVMPAGGGSLDLELDFVNHNLVLRSSGGRKTSFSLYDGLSVAQFYEAVFASLSGLGVEVAILARPYDPARVGSELPFAEDEVHRRYDAVYVTRFWQVLTWINAVFLEFKGRFYGKSTPVHLFWHSLDLAYTRFSGRAAPSQSSSRTDREAYSHEVISFGFWPGDDNVSAPAFYAYSYPEPDGLREAPLLPDPSFWAESNGSSMALLMYDDLRAQDRPKEALLAFLESAYLAGASRAGWDVEAFRPRPLDG